ncbi:zinc-dependent alcohol dehydrogenase family protein [Zunongwangia endophytica]|uniref:Zinc-dependent alcohol dehydrogenase family protein n=1 Tax=Zunongwangia endophytica TaxID=1808945 RepID=A0ABV8HDI5_9FLAO|nr:zinc-dependent alcohol dehydrogenase family protein [Zunongwangia endophytica]MDN3593491.1 zinc-dependent alcohol dehydrogenase family protein [Zunongwangia endophytica]
MSNKENKTEVVRFHETGSADVLKIEEIDLQEPKENEVRIKVKALGLNRAEVAYRSGQYLENPRFPSLIGYEASGIVDAVGSKVSSVAVGDKVSTIPSFSMNDYGTYGETAILPEHAVSHYPDNLSPEEATAIWMPFITAYGGIITNGEIAKDDAVLITAASSSVGFATIALTKLKGGIAIATTRKEEKKQQLLDAGADHVIVTDDEDLVERVMEITNNNGANIIFDPISGPIIETLAKAAAPLGRIVEYGSLSSESAKFPFGQMLQKRLTIQGYILMDITTNPEKLKPAKKFIFEALEKGKLKPTIDNTFDFEDIKKAHEYMESNQQLGKIIVKLN